MISLLSPLIKKDPKMQYKKRNQDLLHILNIPNHSQMIIQNRNFAQQRIEIKSSKRTKLVVTFKKLGCFKSSFIEFFSQSTLSL